MERRVKIVKRRRSSTWHFKWRLRIKNNCSYKCHQDWRRHLIKYGRANIQPLEAIASDGLCLENFSKGWKKISADGSESNVLTVEDMRSAEVIVLQHYQEPDFKEVYEFLNGKGDQPKKLEKTPDVRTPA